MLSNSNQAGEMVEGINVHTFDSKLAAMVEGAYVLKAIEMIEQDYEPQAIIEELYAMREDTGAVLMVDDLKICKKWTNHRCTSMDWYNAENEASIEI
ncbi:DegV family protein [Staphylococcus xylosus]|uniref:DegV family protein n=1 Tax=Staphylococcus xylosus TaxID=1288 RepID=A0A939SRF9_STAXY|nr:DegV family protein [Staphylococcus xylosus]